MNNGLERGGFRIANQHNRVFVRDRARTTLGAISERDEPSILLRNVEKVLSEL
jgi:hypothetical protein